MLVKKYYLSGYDMIHAKELKSNKTVTLITDSTNLKDVLAYQVAPVIPRSV